MEANVYEQVWSPREYLAQYYTTSEIAEDERHIFQFVFDFFKKYKLSFDEMLEVGTGPTIHHLLPFLPHVKKIFVSDYLKSNLKEIDNWLCGYVHAHDWSQYFDGIAKLKGDTSTLGAGDRKFVLRTNVYGLFECDLFKKDPLGRERHFSLVTSFYCAECIVSSKEKWQEAMKNLCSLVAPGGWIILSALRDTDKYMVGERTFSTARINENDIRESLIENGFIPETICAKAYPCAMWVDEGFDSIVVCSGRRP